jgi:acetylornithine deacetylase
MTDLLSGAIEEHADRAVAFLERLVAAPSTIGHEGEAQQLVAAELERLGFDVTEVVVPDDIGDDPTAGVPQTAYRGRTDVLGRMGPERGRSLLVNGHVDVVPPSEPDLWTTDPFEPVRVDGWLRGRGAGDMKAGFAMTFLAVDALRAVAPEAIAGPLSFLSVIEEECTGNGTLAAARQGVLADAVILPEPTDLDLLVAGVGILWLEIDVLGGSGHAQVADRSVNPIEAAGRIIDALRALERIMNEHVIEPAFADVEHPYNVNIGTFAAGDWPSSVPARTRLGVRVGHPTAWSPADAERRIREAVRRAVNGDGWLASNPPTIRPTGFRAQGYAIDPGHPLVRQLARAHQIVHGSEPATVAMGSTTDARYYLNGFGVPAVCYGPRARNIHGVDEAVELRSIVDGAKSLARFIADWYREDDQ